LSIELKHNLSPGSPYALCSFPRPCENNPSHFSFLAGYWRLNYSKICLLTVPLLSALCSMLYALRPRPLCSAITQPHACKPRGDMIFNSTNDRALRIELHALCCSLPYALCSSPPPPVVRYHTSSRLQTPGRYDFQCNK